MKIINLRAIAAAALISCGLSVASPLYAAEPVAATPDTVWVQSQADSFALERLRMEQEHERRMAAMEQIDVKDFIPIFGVFFAVALPILLTFLYLGYRLKKKHDREKLEAQLLIDLAKSGQTLTPELIEKLKREPEKAKEAEPSPTRGLVKTFEGLAFVLMAPLLYFFVRHADRWAFFLLIPGFLLLGQGLALLLADRLGRPAHENPAEKPQA